MVGWVLDLSQGGFEQTLVISLRMTLENKPEASNEHTQKLGSMLKFCMVLANVKESDMQCDKRVCYTFKLLKMAILFAFLQQFLLAFCNCKISGAHYYASAIIGSSGLLTVEIKEM